MNSALHMSGRRLAVQREVEAAQQRRKCVDQVVKGRVAAQRQFTRLLVELLFAEKCERMVKHS